MLRNSHSFGLTLFTLVPLGALLIAGCSKGEAPAETTTASTGGAALFAKNCQGCHGAKGEGANGPNLMRAVSLSDDAIYKTIHDGKGRMPAFSNKLTDAEIKEVVAFVKKLGA